MKTQSAHWQVGFAQCDTTPKPDETTGIAGFAVQRKITGTTTPLRAQAIALKDAAGKLAFIVTADVLCFDPTTVSYMQGKIKSLFNLGPDRLLLLASHTHYGPDTSFRANVMARFVDPYYLTRLEGLIVELMRQAAASLSPATLRFTQVDCRLGCNRRLPDGKGGVLWGPYEKGAYDTHTPIVVIERQTSPKTIVWITHATHPTASGKAGKWSACYPGYFRAKVEKTLGPDAAAVFAMGCGADTKPTYTDSADGTQKFCAAPSQSRVAGHILARAVLKAIKGDLAQLAPKLATRHVQGKLSYAKMVPWKQVRALADNDTVFASHRWWARMLVNFPHVPPHHDYQVIRWTLGDLTLLAMQDEVCAPFGPMLRERMTTPHRMVAAYQGATHAYIPTRKIWREGGYEGKDSHRSWFLPAPFTSKVEREVMDLAAAALT